MRTLLGELVAAAFVVLILGMEVDPGPRASPPPRQMNPKTNEAFCHILCLQ